MEQIKATFFQECDELLADLEAGLLALESGESDTDTVNAVFRAVHSVKGGAGAFGLETLVRFAHVFETTLDLMRSGRLSATGEAVRTLLRAADVLADLVTAAKTDASTDEARTAAIADELAGLNTLHGGSQNAGADEPTEADAGDDLEIDFQPVAFTAPSPAAGAGWRITFKPRRELYAKANDAAILMRELARLGSMQVDMDTAALPGLEELDPEEAYLAWTVGLETDATEEAVREAFEFVDGDCELTVEPLQPAAGEPGAGDDILGLLQRLAGETPPAAAAAPAPALPAVRTEASPTPEPAAERPASTPLQTTIRVDLERVDRLIDLVGELVINQAMLAQRVVEAGMARSSTVAVGLDELEQLTRGIQDSVMAIRAQPVKSVFQRMPRLVREIASMTGKQARLMTEGEGTEVDKTVIERLSDPITHMIRNAIDHGLESPADRIAVGKSPEGTVRLSAQHRSGRIVIEVADDGAGINRNRVRQIALNKGLIDPQAQLSDEEVDNLIFLPGFSTAATISDVSGRGVGMDVVKRSIQALGGRITITSRPGAGSTFSLSLPLTLAVLDGMVVGAAGQTLVAPLTAIIESLQPKAEDVKDLGRGRVLAVRGAYVPLIEIGSALGYRTGTSDPTEGVVLLVESDVGGRAALLVDAIHGQRQVVIKSLESNYQRVDGVAAATILGDGRVALILDVDAVVARHGAGSLRAEPAPSLQLAS
ncbi:MAG: chemotaxis protein CheA [Caulobacterales bacterium 32-69-10]|nr:MAG: chemotaxis protein CheA [Caulobacterales bacterium 32-69-10]